MRPALAPRLRNRLNPPAHVRVAVPGRGPRPVCRGELYFSSERASPSRVQGPRSHFYAATRRRNCSGRFFSHRTAGDLLSGSPDGRLLEGSTAGTAARTAKLFNCSRGIPLHALALTKRGHPRHPLYLKGTCQPIPFTGSLATRCAAIMAETVGA